MKKILFLFMIGWFALSGREAAAQVKSVYQGELDFGYAIGVGKCGPIASRMNLHTIHGAKIGKYCSVGMGVGFDLYHDLNNEMILPVYLNAKGYYPVSEKFSPYFSFDMGVGVGVTGEVGGMTGIYVMPAVGIKTGRVKVQIGCSAQQLSQDVSVSLNAVQFKVGLVF